MILGFVRRDKMRTADSVADYGFTLSLEYVRAKENLLQMFESVDKKKTNQHTNS